jgi:hypothetical protein
MKASVTSVITELLKKGMDPNLKDSKDHKAFDYFPADHPEKSKIEHLLEKYKKTGSNALATVVQKSPSIANDLLEKKNPVPCIIKQKNYYPDDILAYKAPADPGNKAIVNRPLSVGAIKHMFEEKTRQKSETNCSTLIPKKISPKENVRIEYVRGEHNQPRQKQSSFESVVDHDQTLKDEGDDTELNNFQDTIVLDAKTGRVKAIASGEQSDSRTALKSIKFESNEKSNEQHEEQGSVSVVDVQQTSVVEQAEVQYSGSFDFSVKTASLNETTSIIENNDIVLKVKNILVDEQSKPSDLETNIQVRFKVIFWIISFRRKTASQWNHSLSLRFSRSWLR